MTATTTAAPATHRPAPGALAVTLASIAALLLLIGGALIVLHATQRDHDGYYGSSRFRLTAPGYAITSQQLDLAGGGHNSLARNAAELSGSLRLQATAANGRAIFVGIARQPDADRYLGGVAQDEVRDAAGANTRAVTRPGRGPTGKPGDQPIWLASSSGTGTRTVTLKIRPGRWTVAVMNADARRGVQANIRVGLKTTLFLWIGLALLTAALLTGGAAGLRIATRQAHNKPELGPAPFRGTTQA
jgi:hypothetical protein